MQKDQSFILRVRKYELRVAEPFILCRTLVPIMTAAYYISSPFFLYRWNALLPDSLIVRDIGIVILCTAHMVSRPVVAGHLTSLLCHSRAQFLYNDLHAALS